MTARAEWIAAAVKAKAAEVDLTEKADVLLFSVGYMAELLAGMVDCGESARVAEVGRVRALVAEGRALLRNDAGAR